MTNECKITEVRSGDEPTIIVINGFLSESKQDVNDWLDVVDELYPSQRVLHLDWPSFSLKKLFDLKYESKLKNAMLLAIALISPSSSMAKALRDMVVGWVAAMDEAEAAGKWLAAYVDSQKNKNFILMGHSLGARVSYHALANLKRTKSIDFMYLFGGAVSNTEIWDDSCGRHKELKVINCFSENDYVLKYLYKVGTLFTNTPAGLKSIPKKTETLIYNVDLSHIVDGHTTYKNTQIGRCLKERTGLESADNWHFRARFTISKWRLFLPF